MNGPSHYLAAEELLTDAENADLEYDGHRDRLIAAAHVHAALAQTAALALTAPVCGYPNSPGHADAEAYKEWLTAIEGADLDDVPGVPQ
jgi:hypothetical protein